MIKGVTVFSTVHTVRFAGGGVLVFVVQVRVLGAAGITGALGTVVFVYPPRPVLSCIILTHVLGG